MPSLNGFRRVPLDAQTKPAMGAAWTRGEDGHMAPQRASTDFAVETQASELVSSLHVERVNESSGVVPELGGEEGGVLRFDAPGAGEVTKVKLTGSAVLLVRQGGELIIDQRGDGP